MVVLKPTKKQLQEIFETEVTEDLVIQKNTISEDDQKWWYKSLTNLGKLLQAAWDKKKGRV